MITKGQALLAVVAYAVLASVGQVQADTVSGEWDVETDLEAKFEALTKGDKPLKTIDNDGTNGILGPELKVDGTNWDFWVQHKVSQFAEDKAKEVRIGIRGVHVFGPHNGPADDPRDKDPSSLGLVWSEKQDIKEYNSAKFTRKAEVEHPTTNENVKHRDWYTVKSSIEHAQIQGDGHHYVTGKVEIAAGHKEPKKRTPVGPPKLGALGSSHGTGTTVSFVSTGPGTGHLSLSIGAIDILDMNGGLSGGVDARYASDPVLNGQVAVTPLQLMGPGPEGWFEFSGGTVTITDPAGNFTLQADFDDYIVGDTAATDPPSGFGLMTDEYVTDAGDLAGGASLFLDDYTDTNLLGIGVDETTWDMFEGNGLAIITPSNLAQLTNNFTQTYLNVPATVLLSGYLVPGPASVLVLASGLASAIGLGLRRRRR